MLSLMEKPTIKGNTLEQDLIMKTNNQKKRKLNNNSNETTHVESGETITRNTGSRLRTSGYIRALHVLKKDIRRKYQDMYTNVINSHDSWLFTNFLKEFTNPHNVQLTITLPSQPHCPSLFCRGITEIVYGMTSIYLKLPDAVQLYEETAIHVPHQGSGSRIISKMRFKGTRLFEIDNDHLAEEVHRIAASSSSSSSSSSFSSSSHSIVMLDDSSDDNNSLSSMEDLPLRQKTSSDQINHAINAAEQLLIPAMSCAELNRKSRPIVPTSPDNNNNSNNTSIEADLISKFQNLNLYHLRQPKDVLMDGTVILELNELHQIEGIHFQVKTVSEMIRSTSSSSSY